MCVVERSGIFGLRVSCYAFWSFAKAGFEHVRWNEIQKPKLIDIRAHDWDAYSG